MISKRLRIIFGLSIPVFIAHGLEEYITGFYNINPDFFFVFRPLLEMPLPQALFLLLQIMAWLLLAIAFLLVSGVQWQSRLMVILGLLYIYELHHGIRAVLASGYYPGLITAIVLYVLGFFFWREWLHVRKQNL